MSDDTLTTSDPSFKHGYAQIGGVRLHYVECGEGDELIILLHGFPECWYSWRHQLRSLGASNYHVVALDLRGYNLSDKPLSVSAYKMDALVADVLGLIHHFGRYNAVIVGHDWGAAVAWTVAIKHPNYVRKLAALQVPLPAAWAANMTLKQLMKSWYMLFFQLPRLPEWMLSRNDFEALDRMFKKTVIERGAITDADVSVYKAALRDPRSLSGAINYYRANVPEMFFQQRGKEPIARVKVPTLFIFGEKDFAILPETVRNVEAYVDAPYTELRIGNSGHWVQQEAAAEVSAALDRFLKTS
ncbi:MAG: alpha/beta hydrolase [Pyrinomonadaceae bacterium]